MEPVSTKSAVLVAKGFSEQYACVALQLANNNIQTASSYLSMIGARSAEIDAAQKRIENVNIAMSPKSPSISEGLCATCNDNDPMKRDQLVPCTSCNKCYHTMCFGDRKIPFGINNQVDRRSREKFLMKNYSQWSCQECVGESSSSRKLLDRAVQIGNDYKTRTSIPNFTKAWTPSPTADTTASQPIFSDQDKTAALVRILASNGMTVESLMAMSVEKQKEALLDATKLFNSKAVSSSATETVDTNSKDLRTPVKALDSGIISGNAPAVTVPVTNVSPGDDTANVKDLENYADYFSMMKIGMSVANVAQRMLVDGCATDLKSGVAFLNEAKLEGKIAVAAAVEEDGPQEKEVEALAADQETCPASEHPVLSKFFKMKKCLVARPGIEQAMKDAGVPLSYLDKDPNDLVPIQLPKAGDLIAVSEHPLYKTFFNQLKYRTPIAAIKNKMELAGLDSSIIDKDPSELIPLEVQKPVSKATKSSIKQALRKKKIHWKPLDASKVGKDSLWADKDEDIELDEDEFNRLFVESCENKKSPINKIKVEKKKVSVIDAKRAQNGSISLARIKMQCERHETHQKIREHIENMVDEPFTSEQLQSLLEFLPTPEEESMLKNFKGDAEYLGPAEKYMIAMSDFPSAMSRIDCMIYKQQFRSRIQECKDTLLKIESACDDVKSSEKLKKVLRYILRVGNKLNDGEELAGFSVESLLKLQTAKAFDKNTTVLEYIIRAIFKSANDQGCLQFPDELPHVSEASKLMMENVLVEAHGLRVGLDNAVKVITDLTRNKNIDKMAAFLYKVFIS